METTTIIFIGRLDLFHPTKEKFPRGVYDKLKLKKISHFQILKKFFDSAYVLDLLEDLNISLSFNVADVYRCKEGLKSLEELTFDW